MVAQVTLNTRNFPAYYMFSLFTFTASNRFLVGGQFTRTCQAGNKVGDMESLAASLYPGGRTTAPAANLGGPNDPLRCNLFNPKPVLRGQSTLE